MLNTRNGCHDWGADVHLMRAGRLILGSQRGSVWLADAPLRDFSTLLRFSGLGKLSGARTRFCDSEDTLSSRRDCREILCDACHRHGAFLGENAWSHHVYSLLCGKCSHFAAIEWDGSGRLLGLAKLNRFAFCGC